jgi:DNA end-binding protein Ku
MIWKGHISFGLVSIPVALYPAESRDELDFTLLDKKDLSPVGYRKVNKETGEEVPSSRLTRGLEYRKGRYVIVGEEALRRASPERTQRIEILSFAEPADIAPPYFDRPYYLEPQAKSEKAYVLLREALRRAGKVAIASVVIRTRQHLAALVPDDAVLVLNLLRYAAELRDPGELSIPRNGAKAIRIRPKEQAMADQLVASMVAPWEPERYRDEYKDEVLAFVKRQIKAGKAEDLQAPAPRARREKKGTVVDMMALLRESLQASRKRPARGEPRRKSA